MMMFVKSMEEGQLQVYIEAYPYLPMTLTFDPLTFKISRLHPLIMDNMCAKLDETTSTLNTSFFIAFQRLLPYKFAH